MSSLDCKQSSSCSVWTSGTLPFSLASDSSVGQYGTDFKQLQRTSLSHKVHHCLLFFGLEKPCQPVWPDSWGSPIRHHPPDMLEEKVCNTCQTWGEVWARAVMDARRVFNSQRHAKLSGARLHGAPSPRQTATPLPLLEQMVCLRHTAQKVRILLCGFLVVS